MQYRVSIPNDRNLHCEKDISIISEKWKEINIYQNLASIVLIPCVIVAFWRGSWDLMDHYHHFFPLGPTLAVSGLIASTLEILRNAFISKHLKILDDDSRCTVFKKNVLLSFYDVIYNLSNVALWWVLWGHPEGPDMWPAVTVSLICFIPLVLMRAARNLVAPPIVIITDSKEFAFNFPTRYRIDGTREPGLYILDCLFSVLVIGSLVVFVWRGLWVLLDLKLFPGDVKMSAWASLIIGYAIVGCTFLMQPVMRWACEKLEGFWRIIAADIFLFVSFVGTVNVWRGIWALLDCYFLPDNKLLSDWITHGVSLILLILLNCSNSVLVRGVYIDAEEPAGQCVIFPVYYIRLFFQKERTKKQKRLMEKLEKIDHNNTVLLIEKPQMNHDPKIIHTSLSISEEDVEGDGFSESDKNNKKIDENGENKNLCCGE